MRWKGSIFRDGLGILALVRKTIEAGKSYQLREPSVPYGVHFGVKKDDVGPKKSIFGTLSYNIQQVSATPVQK